jgi:hypothetical protein
MSRIRESVRLRLVPPRDYDAAAQSGPIHRFLQAVRALRKKFPLGDGSDTVPPDRAPFQLQLTLSDARGNMTSQTTIRPSPQTKNVGIKGAVTSLAVEVLLDPAWTFLAGSLAGQATLKGVVQPPDPIDLSLAKGLGASGRLRITFTLPGETTDRQTQFVFKISGWKAQTIFAAADDPAVGGDLTFTVTVGEASNNTLAATLATNPLALAFAPCAGEPCAPPRSDDATVASDCGDGKPSADPTPVLPWLNGDPTHETSAGDPKVLVLAALASWLVQMLVREQAGTSSEITSPRREIAQGIYRIAWLLLFGLPEGADPAALGITLRQLLEAWCDGALWTGPRCCGDPHGIVIGCALVEGGTIKEIDQFGGRRYVVHYPLLEHWGAEFGLAPLDVIAMRFFSRVCCLAGLHALSADTSVPTGLVALGAGFLAVGDPKAIAVKMRDKKIAAQRSVHTPEMIASALTLLGTKPAEKDVYAKLVLADFAADQTVVLLVPVPP